MIKLSIIIAIVAAGSFAAGWQSGQRSAVKLAGNVLRAQMFNAAAADVAQKDVVIEELNAGKTDDAMYFLQLQEDGAILSLENSLATDAISYSDLKDLRNFDAGLRNHPERETADKILARIAARRAQHPWTYNGSLPQNADPDVEAKLTAILKRAADRQNVTNTTTNR